MKVVKFKDQSEWLAKYRLSLGGSKIASICGENPFESPYQLWRKLKGIDPEDEANYHMILGNIFEPAVVKLFEHETGNREIKLSEGFVVYEHDKFPFISVTPDRRIMLNGGGKGILEVKTTRSIFDHDDMPRRWYFQLELYLGMVGYKRGYVAWFEWITQELKWREFDFDPDFYNAMIHVGVDWWNRYIIGDEEPDISTGNDVTIKYPHEIAGKTIQATDEMEKLYSNIRSLSDKSSALKSMIDVSKEQVKLAMRDAEVVESAEEKLFTFKANKDSVKIDVDRFAHDYPALFDQYKIVVPGPRILRVKGL